MDFLKEIFPDQEEQLRHLRIECRMSLHQVLDAKKSKDDFTRSSKPCDAIWT